VSDDSTFLTVLGVVGAALCGAGLQQHWGRWGIVLLWALGIAFFALLPALRSRRNRLQQGRKAAQSCIKKALTACGSAYGYPDKHVRANVMLASKGGTRRQVDTATAFNMETDPDQDLEIDVAAGVSGEAFRSKLPVYGDLSLALQPGGPTWGLRDAERAKVRSGLKSVLSVPIFDPDDPEGSLLGTLQVDSDLTMEQMEFDKPERRAVAERFADVVALLLKVGR
jgi:hypothetical protein